MNKLFDIILDKQQITDIDNKSSFIIEIDVEKLLLRIDNQQYYLGQDGYKLVELTGKSDNYTVNNIYDIHSLADFIDKCRYILLNNVIIAYIPQNWIKGIDNNSVAYIFKRQIDGFHLLHQVLSYERLTIKDTLNVTNIPLFIFEYTENKRDKFLISLLADELALNHILVKTEDDKPVQSELHELIAQKINSSKLPDKLVYIKLFISDYNTIYYHSLFKQKIIDIFEIMPENAVCSCTFNEKLAKVSKGTFNEGSVKKSFKSFIQSTNMPKMFGNQQIVFFKNVTTNPCYYSINELLLHNKPNSICQLQALKYPSISVKADLILNYQALSYTNLVLNSSRENVTDYSLVLQCPVYLKRDAIEILLSYNHTRLVVQGKQITSEERYINKKLEMSTVIMRTETDNTDEPLLTLINNHIKPSEQKQTHINENIVWRVSQEVSQEISQEINH